MIITVPQVLKHPDVGYLLLSGGTNNDPYLSCHQWYSIFYFSIRVPTGSSTTALAEQSGTIAVEIQQIPNQPIQFYVLLHLR